MTSLKASICALAAASLLLGSVPAQAENNAGKVLAGLAGLAILAKILEADRAASTPRPDPQPVLRNEGGTGAWPQVSGARIGVGPKASGGKGYRRCLRQRWTRGGWVSYLEPDCVERINERRLRRKTRQRAWR